MKPYNIFDEITSNDDVPDIALCAVHDLLKNLLYEFEHSAFRRIKQSFQNYHAACDNSEPDASTKDPF